MEEINDQPIRVEQKSVLNSVTPFSKFLTAVLFIILPFIGGWVGFSFAPERVVVVNKVVYKEIERVDEVKEIAQKESEMISNEDGTIPLKQIAYIKFEDDDTFTNLMWDYERMFDFATKLSVDSVGEEPLLSDEWGPYYFLETETETYFIFSQQGGNGVPSGLYKFDKSTADFSEMKVSDLYLPFYNGTRFSPDRRNVMVIVDSIQDLAEEKLLFESDSASALVVLNMDTDDYVVLAQLDSEDEKRFVSNCEQWCETNMEWVDNQTVVVRVYDFEECSEDLKCETQESVGFEDTTFSVRN